MYNHNDLAFRPYRPKDDIEITSLFNKTFGNYAGFVPRTPQYWSWYYKSRYDVKEDGIIVLEQNGRIVAYAIVGQTGNIWEFSYDRENGRKEEIASLLIDKAVAYAANSGANEIRLHAPQSDKLIAQICYRMGFTSGHFKYLFLSVSDFTKLIQKILNRRQIISLSPKTFQITVIDAPTWMNKDTFIEFNTPSVTVSVQSTKKPDVIIEATVSALTEVIFRKKNVLWSFLKREIRIMPIKNLPSAVKLLALLSQNSVWFTPQGDCF
jgi:ribosomal protein S18 acetylase RimI-like enzyme